MARYKFSLKICSNQITSSTSKRNSQLLNSSLLQFIHSPKKTKNIEEKGGEEEEEEGEVGGEEEKKSLNLAVFNATIVKFNEPSSLHNVVTPYHELYPH